MLLIGIANFSLILKMIDFFSMKESTHKQNCEHLHPILWPASCLENHSGWPAIPVGTSRTMGSMDTIYLFYWLFSEKLNIQLLRGENNFFQIIEHLGIVVGHFVPLICKQNVFSQSIIEIICTAIYKVDNRAAIMLLETESLTG